MKNIDKLSVIGALLICTAVSLFSINTTSQAATLTNTEGPVRLNIYAVPVPYLGSNGYTATASNLVQWVYNNPGQKPPGEVGYKLQTGYIAQPASGYTSNTVWFMIDAAAKDPAYKFLPSCLSFGEVSTDGRLNKTDNTLGSNTWWYGSSSEGVIFGPDNGNTIATGFWYQTPVNRFIYVGDASEFFTFTPDGGSYPYSELDGYITGWTADYQITGTWTFNDTNYPTVHASKTLHKAALQSNLDGKLTIMVITNDVNLAISLKTDDNNTFTLQSSDKPVKSSGGWQDDTTINPSDVIIRPATNGPSSSVKLWRAVLQ
jgi:hypothetical protein